jgi:hypothetical protein
MNAKEKKIVDRLVEKCGIKDLKVSRRSDREYDLSLEGRYMREMNFSAWLPLFAIRELTLWPSEEIAQCTDYPEMVVEGDWSGVRDSDPEKIWAIFHRFV